MIKSNGLKQVLFLVEFFINSALKGILNRPFFSSKIRKTIFFAIFFSLYFAYFMYNMSELNHISSNLSAVDNSLLHKGQAITFFSYFSNTITLAIVSFVFVETTVSLDKSSLFFVKALPHQNIVVYRAYVLFKIIVMLTIYGLVSVIAVPTIKLITDSFFEGILFSITQFLTFLITVILLECCTRIFKITWFVRKSLVSVVLSIHYFILLLSTLYYFFHFRYEFESTLANNVTNLSSYIIISFSVAICLFCMFSLIIYSYPTKENIFISRRYIRMPVVEKTIFRNKQNIGILLLFFTICTIVTIQSGINIGIIVGGSLLPFAGILLLHFADVTALFRKQFDLIRISYKMDWFYQFCLIMLLSLPSVLMWLLSIITIHSLLKGMSFSVASLLLGYLFPKSYGSLNEFTSVLLLMSLFVAFGVFSNMLEMELLVLFSLIVIHFMIVRKVRNEKL